MGESNDKKVVRDSQVKPLSEAYVERTSRTLAANEGMYVYRFVKRSFDILAAAFAIAVLAIPFLIICIVIVAESPGPPVYAQRRVGRFGRPIRIFKLRSMYSDAEENMEWYLSDNQYRDWIAEHKVDEDPRVTRFGRFIRKTSLDEIPQFLNVLLGQMSLVGPRPVTRKEIDEWFPLSQVELLSVTPGLTGYWQAYARNEATFESGERQRMELFYVRNRGFALDARIILSTFVSIFKRTGR